MIIDVSRIVTDKLTQMEAEAVVKKALEKQIEKTVLDAVTSSIDSWAVKDAIGKQLKDLIDDGSVVVIR